MPQSLSSVYLHAVFSTKQRHPFLSDPAFRRESHALLAGISKRLDCPALEVGGYDDHLHLLVRFGKEITVSDWLRELKRVSSSKIKEKIPDFAWQSGYGVFSVAAEGIDGVASYIQKQEEHHRKVSFQDEFRQIMREHDVEWDERFVWG